MGVPGIIIYLFITLFVNLYLEVQGQGLSILVEYVIEGSDLGEYFKIYSSSVTH